MIEAGTNAIQPATTATRASRWTSSSRAADVLEIVVHDTGRGSTPSRERQRDVAEHLLDLRGRGIFIMRTCMDQVDWTFSSHGTTCRLLKKRPPAPPPEN